MNESGERPNTPRAPGSGGAAEPLPAADQFYGRFVSRNRGLIPPQEQERLRRATILVAGCGSIGGAAIEPLVRLGAEHLVLAEPDDYEMHNMNRQAVRLQDIGRNKAVVFKERMAEINPHAVVEADTRGIAPENVEALARRADLVIDGVDVTTRPPLRHKFALHVHAKRFRVPVVSGYDIAGLQLLLVYDYRRPGVRVLDGRVDARTIGDLGPNEFLSRVVPLRAVPHEIIPELERRVRGESEGFPQLVYTAHLFAALVTRASLDLLAGRPVRHRVMVDANDRVRPLAARARAQLERVAGLYRIGKDIRRYRRGGTAPADEAPDGEGSGASGTGDGQGTAPSGTGDGEGTAR